VPQDYWQMIPDGVKPGWSLTTEYDGDLLRRAKLGNPHFGVLYYGKSPSGNYDQWWFQEVGGGGSVILPYTVDPSGRTFIGLVLQRRPLQDEVNLVWGFPRGFKPREMTHDEAAAMEYREETGDFSAVEVVRLEGDGGNPNNAFFDSREGGMQFYTVKLPWEAFIPNPQGEGIVFRTNELTAEQKLELIQGCVFIEDDFRRISRLGDMISHSCYLRWLAYRQV